MKMTLSGVFPWAAALGLGLACACSDDSDDGATAAGGAGGSAGVGAPVGVAGELGLAGTFSPAAGASNGPDVEAELVNCEQNPDALPVQISGNEFSPESPDVSIGDVVEFENVDDEVHSVVSGEPGAADGLWDRTQENSSLASQPVWCSGYRAGTAIIVAFTPRTSACSKCSPSSDEPAARGVG